MATAQWTATARLGLNLPWMRAGHTCTRDDDTVVDASTDRRAPAQAALLAQTISAGIVSEISSIDTSAKTSGRGETGAVGRTARLRACGYYDRQTV